MPPLPPFLPDESYRFLGHALAVRSNSPEVLDYIRSVYHWFRPPHPEPAPAVLEVLDRLALAGELVIRDDRGSFTLPCRDIHALDGDGDPGMDADSYPLAHVEAALLRYVARLATGHDLLHAAALAVQGRAVMLAGPSGRGKSTLCLALLARGFELLSDELACVRRRGAMVDPFPRVIKFDEQSRRVLHIPRERVIRARYTAHGEPLWLLEVEDAAPAGVAAPAPLRGVVLLEGFAARTRLEPVSPMQALLALSRLSLRRAVDPAATVFRAAPFVGAVPCYTLIAGDLDDAADAVNALMSADAGVGT
jgi:hypothetical protein